MSTFTAADVAAFRRDGFVLKPSVISLAFGVFFAFFVSLFLVPALYLIGDDWRKTRAGLARFFPRLSKEEAA